MVRLPLLRQEGLFHRAASDAPLETPNKQKDKSVSDVVQAVGKETYTEKTNLCYLISNKRTHLCLRRHNHYDKHHIDSTNHLFHALQITRAAKIMTSYKLLWLLPQMKGVENYQIRYQVLEAGF